MIDATGTLRVREQLQPYLRPGEELLWCGAPDPSVLFTSGDLFIVPFSLLWLAFVASFETAAVSGNGGPFPVLWGIPFIAIGLYMVVGRFVVKRYRKTRTAYGVTTDRAIVVTGRSFADLPLQGQPISLRRSRNGRHVSVTFGGVPEYVGRSPLRRPRSGWMYGMYANTGMEPLMRNVEFPAAFYDVADPDALIGVIDRVRLTS